MLDTLILALVILVPFVRTPALVTSPFGYICGFIGFMFVGKYCYNLVLGVPFLEQAEPNELASHFRAMSAYLAIAFALALPFCNPRRHIGRIARVGSGKSGFTLTTPALMLLILLPVLLVALGLSFGLNPISNPLAFRQFIQSQGMFYLLSIYIFLLGAVSIYVPYIIIAQRKMPSSLVMLAYAVSAGFAIISGFASMIVSMITVPLFFWSVCYRKRIELGLVLLLPVVVVFVVLYTAYRDANLSGSDISVTDAIHLVADNPDAAANLLNRFDYLEGFAKAHRYLENQDPDWGASMIQVLLQPVPRALWPEKPDNFSTSMTRELLPDNLQIGVTANFNSLNEFVKSFGDLGVLVGGLFLAAILVVTYCVFDAAVDRPYLAVYYVIVLFNYFQMGFYAGFVNDLAFPSLVLENIFFLLFVRKCNTEAFVATPKSTRFFDNVPSADASRIV
jgi:hypothetical protein